jgi:hypothetical protein
MTVAFVDSGAWIALANDADAFHARAREFFRTISRGTQLLTSNYIIGEAITLLTYRRFRDDALRLVQRIEDSVHVGWLTVVWVTPEVHEQALALYRRYDDQLFSFGDCTSFAICLSRRVDFVFGFDNDFRIVGLDLRPGTQ